MKEPRKGALFVTLLLAFITVAVVAAYFFVATPREKGIPQISKANPSLANTTSAGAHPQTQTAATPPAAEQNPEIKQRRYPKTGGDLREEAPLSHLTPGTGRLAIIVDDMGSSVSEARTLSAIGVPLTFSVIPGLHSYREVALFAESKNIEIMIHIPMQSRGWPGRRLESNGLLLSMGNAELRERVSGFLRDMPKAVGANNHMGSEFTEHEEKMRSVLETLKSKNLFYVDSVTSMQTIGLRLARELGIKAGRRHVFLDNEQERDYILGQLGQAVKLAKKTGYAIAICHPHPETITTLASELPGLSGQGITLVPVSQLVR